MNKQTDFYAYIVKTVRAVAGFAVLLLGIVSILASGDIEDFLDGDDGGGSPRTILRAEPESPVLFVAAGESVSVRVDTVTNNTQGRELPPGDAIGYRIFPDVAVKDRKTFETNLDADYIFDTSIRTAASPRVALLTITTRPVSKPGIYHFKIRSKDITPFFFRAETLRVVVVPTGGTIKTGKVRAVAAGLRHTLALLEDGTVWAWGWNAFGQLGDGTTLDRNVPVQVQGLTGPVTAIAAGARHSLALGEDGRVYSWGANDKRQLGKSWDFITPEGCPDGRFNVDNRELTFSVARPVSTAFTASGCDFNPNPLENVTTIGAGDAHSMALQSSGAIAAWGDNANGQLGRVAGDDPGVPFAESVENLPGAAIRIAAGNGFSLALMGDGTVWGWGRNDLNQLGLNAIRDHFAPVGVPLLPTSRRVRQVRAGSDFAVALVEGEPGFTAWGNNLFGQLGNNTTTPVNLPPLLPTAPHLSIARLAAGQNHVVAALPDGQVWAWGDNTFGQMGEGSAETAQTFPVRVPGLIGVSGVNGVAAGGWHSLARHNACGTLWGWGRNLDGQLGQSPALEGDGIASQAQKTPLPVYGLGEAGNAAPCQVGLHVFVRKGGRVVSDTPDFPDPGCAGVCGAALEANSMVTLTAFPDDGFAFASWGGDCKHDPFSSSILLTLNESKNCFANFEQVVVINQPPTADFTHTPQAPALGETVTFDAGASRDDGTIVGYLWDFGDGAPQENTAVPRITHTYAAAERYTVRLRVTDDGGLTAETTQDITVTPAGGGTFTLTLTIQGGPGAGEVVSGESPIPNMNCVNSATPETTCTADYASGAEIFLIPTPFGINTNVTWTGCDSDFGIEGCTLTMNAARTVTAAFSP